MSESNIITVNKYLEFLAQEKLMASKCPKCGQVDLPARRLCTKCQSESLWHQLSGKGKIATFTAISVGNKLMNDKGYGKDKPYVFCVAKMDEGPMLAGQLIGVDEKKPELIKIGLPLKVGFQKIDGGKDKEGKPIILRTDITFSPL